jgi:hypothetical protein
MKRLYLYELVKARAFKTADQAALRAFCCSPAGLDAVCAAIGVGGRIIGRRGEGTLQVIFLYND